MRDVFILGEYLNQWGSAKETGQGQDKRSVNQGSLCEA
jgi:hypothetical protein